MVRGTPVRFPPSDREEGRGPPSAGGAIGRTVRQEGRYSVSLTVTCKKLGKGDRSASSCHEPMPRRPAAKLP